MTRPLRLEFKGALYHITARGNEKKEIYREPEDYGLFLTILADVVEEMRWLLHGYCLMLNHYHLLLQIRELNLSEGMRQLNAKYAQLFNRKYRRAGHLFQGRFKSILVDKEAYLLELCRYIVLNPVRAGITNQPQKWDYSSYCATAGLKRKPSYLHIDWVLDQFDSDRENAQSAYRNFVAEGTNQSDPWISLVGQIYLGKEDWLRNIQEALSEKTVGKEIPSFQTQPAYKTIDELLNFVTEVYGVESIDLQSRRRDVVEARHMAIYLCRQLGGYDLVTIGNRFAIGYTRVSQIVGKMRDKVKSDKELQAIVRAARLGNPNVACTSSTNRKSSKLKT